MLRSCSRSCTPEPLRVIIWEWSWQQAEADLLGWFAELMTGGEHDG